MTFCSILEVKNKYCNQKSLIEGDLGMGQRQSQGKLGSILINEKENTTFQNLWDATNAVLRGKLIALNVYIKKKKNIK